MAGKHISLLVHFVWSTAGREPWISQSWEDELYKVIGGIIRNKKGKLLEAGGVSDHIHLYTSLPSTVSLDVMRYIQRQKEHHRRRDFKSEFIELLNRHEIEYDERYIWR